jgi:MoaA/NifB/PqqE/SkfB family radical SAM enzyme
MDRASDVTEASRGSYWRCTEPIRETGGHEMKHLSDRVRTAIRTRLSNNEMLKRSLRAAETDVAMLQHAAGSVFPSVIGPRPRKLILALTAHCNLRCKGCRYGRDFMPGQQLPYQIVEELLIDAEDAGIETVRLYGGEPLLYPDLSRVIRRSIDLGLSTYVTTNGILLKQKIEQLYDAGLRKITIGFYGTGEAYDRYVDRAGRYRRLEESVAFVRERYGSSVSMQLNFLLMRPSCTLQALQEAWEFAERYDLEFHTDLIHYSLPYFTEGRDRDLQFVEADRDNISGFVAKLVELKMQSPDRMKEATASILSIPAWLLKGPEMRVPCDARKLIWAGADGTVKLCYVTFELGNLHERRLRDMLFTAEHRRAAYDAFALNCPACHCERESRILKHLPSRLRYGAMAKEIARQPPTPIEGGLHVNTEPNIDPTPAQVKML